MDKYYNTESERVVISTLLHCPEVIPEFIALCGVDDSIFTSPVHKKIFTAILEIYGNNDEVNIHAVRSIINDSKCSKYMDGLIDIVGLQSLFSISGNLLKLKDKRKLLEVLKTSIPKVENNSVEDIVSDINSVIESGIRQGQNSWVRMDEVVDMVEDEVKQRVEGQWEFVSYGNELMDKILGGIRDGDIVTIAGRPSSGKTLASQTIGISVAKQHYPVLILSYETQEKSIAKRYIASETDITYAQLDRWDREDWFDKFGGSLNKAKEIISNKPLYIDYSQPIAEEMYSKVLQFKHQHPDVKLVIVDYLQRVPVADNSLSKYEKVSKVAATTFRIAKKLNVCLMQLSQLSRSIERRDNPYPKMSDLRESGDIEQDSDIIIFIHRPGMYDQSINPNDCEFITGKNRNGPLENIPVKIIPEKFKFVEV